MFERKERGPSKATLLTGIATNWAYDSFHSHEEIAAIIGVPYNSIEYRATINIVSKRLDRHGKCIESVRGEGYRVINPNEYVDFSKKIVDKGHKSVHRAIRVLAHAPITLMSTVQKTQCQIALDRIRRLDSHVNAEVKNLDRLISRNITINQR